MENSVDTDDSLLRVVAGPYEGIVVRLLGPAVGGDVAVEAVDVSGAKPWADVHPREVLYIWPTEIDP